MRRFRSKAKTFALGLATCSIPWVALADGVPLGNMSIAGPTSASETSSVPASVGEESADANTGGWLVQVGAFSDRNSAQAQLMSVSALVPHYDLQNAQFVDRHVDDEGRALYRAQFTALDESTARSLCDSLAAAGENCFVSRIKARYPEARDGAASAATSTAPGQGDRQESSTRNLALASIQPIDDHELENARGGFDVGGVNFNFGASIQTMVNGQLALQTNLQWTPTGPVVTQLQGLGTQIQSQVASTLAGVGINVPAINPPAQPGTAATSTTGTTPITGQTAGVPATVVGNLQTPSSGPATLLGGSITSSLPTPANLAASSAGNTAAAVSNAPSSTTTVPLSFTGISPTAPSGGSSSGPQSSVANVLATAAAAVPSNAGNNSPTTGPTTSAQSSNVAAPNNSPASTSGSSPAVLSGVQIQSPTGTTQIFTNVSNGQIQNVILNSASNQNIVQNTNLMLTIYNFSSWQQVLAQHALAAQLANQVLAASGFTGGR